MKKVLTKYGIVFLFSLCVFDVASSLTLWRLERDFVRSIESGIMLSGSAVDQVKEATSKVHAISKDRIGLLARSDFSGWISPGLTPSLAMGLFGEGACGYISFLEIEVLEAMGFAARPVQILGEDGLNRHVIVEATKGNETIFVDPLYNWVYLNDAGQPATRMELETIWSTLTANTPQVGILQYPVRHGIRYTNWEALGDAGLILRKAFVLCFGEAFVKEFSWRAVLPHYYILRISIVGCICLLFFFVTKKVL